MVLLVGQLAIMCPKPKPLKHFVLEVLVENLVLEGEGFLEFCGVFSLEELEGLSCFENLFLPVQDEL